MVNRNVKIALAQVCNGWPGHPESGESKEIHEFHRKQLDPFVIQAGEEKADIICFCENAMGHGNKSPVAEKQNFEDVLTGLSFKWASAHARKYEMYIIMPITGIYKNAISNVAVVIDRKGEALGVYNKVHLARAEREKGLQAGDDWPVFDLDFGKIGLMICHDMEFPESARCLSLNGAEIIFCPTHWGNTAGDDWVFSIIKGTAAMNGVYMAWVSLAPKEGVFWQSGGSISRTGVIGGQGEWRFSGGFAPGLTVGSIDLNYPIFRKWHGGANDDFRKFHLADRRTDTYGKITES